MQCILKQYWLIISPNVLILAHLSCCPWHFDSHSYKSHSKSYFLIFQTFLSRKDLASCMISYQLDWLLPLVVSSYFLFSVLEEKQITFCSVVINWFMPSTTSALWLLQVKGSLFHKLLLIIQLLFESLNLTRHLCIFFLQFFLRLTLFLFCHVYYHHTYTPLSPSFL